jgi:hypothetical protein
LVLIEPYQSSYDEIKCTRIVYGFDHSIDLVCTENGLFVIESNQSSPNMYRIHFDKPSNVNALARNQTTINVYPNPSKDWCLIEVNSDDGFSNLELLITNSIGQKVYERKTEQKSTTVNVSAFDQGVYFLRIHKNGAEISNHKLIIYE